MPSPFPGMDPWLEAPTIWPDFHDRFAEEISASLNRTLPHPFYAQLGVREELGIVGQIGTRRIVPDVSVQSSKPKPTVPPNQDSGNLATVEAPRSNVTESVQLELYHEPETVNFVEIRDARSQHDVVTLIEILSPSNKSIGSDFDSYVRKRKEILGSTTSLIEIDLLRDGRRDLYGAELHQRLYDFDPPLDYLVFIQRAWHRATGIRYQLFPIRLPDILPVIAIPLRESDPDVPLDLQYAFQQTYDRGPYQRGAVNYDLPPSPPLIESHSPWVKNCIAAWKKRD